MTEPEVLFPVKCPICKRESLIGFRISVIADALGTGEIRLYSNCHVAAWDASECEIDEMCEYLDTEWGANLQGACQEFFTPDLPPPGNGREVAFIYAGEPDLV